MVYRWNCRHCEFIVWSETKSSLRRSVQSHLLDHSRGSLFEDGFRIGWQCPHCSSRSVSHDGEEAVRKFKQHLFDHETDRLRSGSHVTDEVGDSGNVLVLSPPNSQGATTARAHFFDPADVLVLVTMNVTDRLRELDQRLTEWPTRTIILTTKAQPLAGIEDLDIDVGSIPLEIVQLDKGLGLGALGETISRVVAEHESPERQLSVAFDILSEIVSKSELERVFKFLHLLTSRLEAADAVSHYYWTPESQSGPALNVLSELFDLRLEATGDRLVADM